MNCQKSSSFGESSLFRKIEGWARESVGIHDPDSIAATQLQSRQALSSVEPFSISCTTCRVSLKVRDPSVIGQILTCPKCGSMVLVSQPETAESDSAADVNSQAPSRPIPPELPRTKRTAGDPPAAEADWDADFSAEGAADTVDDVVLPTDEWASVSARRWRTRLQLGVGIALAGFLLLGGVAIWVMRQPPLPQPLAEVSEPELSDRGDAPEAAADSPPAPTETITDTELVDDTAEEIPLGNSPGLEVGAESGSPPVSVVPMEEAPAEFESTVASEAGSPDTSVPAELTSDVAVPDGIPEVPMIPDDAPPGLVPREATGASPAERLSDTGALSRMLRNVDSLLNDTEVTDLPPAVGTPAAAPEMTETAPEAAPSEVRPEPQPVDVTARLGDTIQAIEFEDATLIELLRFVSAYSTVPISIHPESLAWTQVSPNTLVSAAYREETVSNVLERTLTPLGLSFEVVDEQVIVRRARSDGGVREVPLVVDDLTEGDSQRLSELSNWIQRLVAPGTWGGAPGTIRPSDGSLTVIHHDDVVLETIFLCEKLRIARGLPTRSRYSPEAFSIEPCSVVAKPALDRSVRLSFLEPTSLTTILGHLEEAARVRLLVDWPSLAVEGWNASAQRSLTVDDRPLETALNELLEPMNLAFRAVSAEVFQIASTEKLAERQYIEFYREAKWLADGLPIAEATKALQTLLDESGLVASFVVDPTSRTLIVLGNAEVHRELGG